ncbi:hypothetical protein CCAX7_32670 [Capsulimonas corticalis]|uniref:F5/8 type C domain-containing protein n=2 Tax=Capsulimonas corticalis TaxID=2219043 RepID=A0A9N7L430_9BACT|nr:hypothetical protein CCAX7_32670 [Capsulimonas corticalis]
MAQPPAASAAAPTRIMPLGDSVTDGWTPEPGGYRIQLWNDIVNSGEVAEFVGSQFNGPAALGSHHHEGHAGWTTSDIAGQVSGWMAAYAPQIVLLQIGTNDINMNKDPAGAPSRLSGIIDQICTQLPAGGKVFVTTLTPESDPNFNNQILNFNNQLPGIVQSKQSVGKPVFLVDQYHTITTADLADGTHPTPAGYSRMGDAWFSAIQSSVASGGTGVNVAVGKAVTASSSGAGRAASLAVDANCGTEWTANGNIRPSSLTVDLGANVNISRAETQFEFGDGEFYQYRIDSSTDGVNWTTYADRTGNTAPTSLYVDNNPVTARYFRVTGTAAQNSGDWIGISEFQLYNGASTVAASSLTNGVYEILAKTTGNALDCTGCGNTNGTQVELWNTLGGSCQQWAVSYKGGGAYSVRTINPDGSVGRSLDATGCSPNDGTQVELWDFSFAPCQQWQINPQPDGFFNIATNQAKSDGTHDVLDGNGCSGAAGTHVILWSWGGGGCQQEWQFAPINTPAIVSGAYYTLTNVAAGLNLDDPNGTNAAGTKVQLFPANGATAQNWKLTRQADGNYTLTNQAGGLNLDDPNGLGAGTLQQIWPANGASAQEWKLTASGSGAYTLTNAATNLNLDDPNGANTAGTQIQLWASNGATPQQWRLTPQ